MQLNKHLKHITCLLVLLLQTACANTQSVKLAWNIPEGETVHYEMVTTSSGEVDMAPSNPPPDALEGVQKMFGDTYKDGKLTVESKSFEFIIMEGLTDNAVRAKTIVDSYKMPEMGEGMPPFTDFTDSMGGLLKLDVTIQSDGTIKPNIKEMFGDMAENPEDIEEMQGEEMEEWVTYNLIFPNHFFFIPPSGLNKVGDSVPFEPKSLLFQHGEMVNHERSGEIVLTDIQKDDSDHDIAVLEYTYHESGELKDFGSTLEKDNTSMAMSYNGLGYFDVTAGRWYKIEGTLSTNMNFVGDISGDTKILIAQTDKEPPEIKTFHDMMEEVKAKNPEMFEEPEITSDETAPVLCDGRKKEGDDCMEDPLHRWRLLQEERVERQMDPEAQQKHCDECNEICSNTAEDNPDDPLHRWRCLQCQRVCNEKAFHKEQNSEDISTPDKSEKPRYEWNIRGKDDIEKLLNQKE